MLKAVRLVVLLLGTGLAGYLMIVHGGEIGQSLARVGWGALPYMGASFLVYALDTWGWRLAFAEHQPAVGFGRLFGIRMAGEAVNKITPLASMGGEPLKAYLLTRDGACGADSLASVAVAKNTMTLAQIAFIFVGVLFALRSLPGQERVLLSLAAFPGLVLSAILVTAVLDLRLRRSGRRECGPETDGDRWRRWLPGKKSALDLWSRVADAYWCRPRAFAVSFVLFFLGWAAGALELLAAAWALGFTLSPMDALALEALLCSVNMATFFVPANAGAQEGGFAFLAPLMGLSSPHGLALAVLRRCRDVIWVLFGLTYLSATEGRVLFRPKLEAAEPTA